jgi:hypothetical protein
VTVRPSQIATVIERGVAMRTYERPTLTLAGSFKRLTGESGWGPRDVLTKHQRL